MITLKLKINLKFMILWCGLNKIDEIPGFNLDFLNEVCYNGKIGLFYVPQYFFRKE